MSIAAIFRPDHVRYEGVRPINIYVLRLFYFLIAIFLSFDAWSVILTHEGPWENHVRAVAFCMWATYGALSALGIIHPLKMLPIMMFTIGYKTLWLIIVAYPLWRDNALIGSPAEAMARIFLWTPLLVIAVPWGYVFRTYVMWSKKK